jgi:hypothetical protein
MDYFDDGTASAEQSLAYFREHRHELGAIVAAAVSFPGLSEHYPYCLELWDDQGNQMFLSGLCSGYPGESPRAAMELLVDAGFPVVDTQRVMHDRQVSLHQPSWPARVSLDLRGPLAEPALPVLRTCGQ